jgi:predicted transcriptional regulator
MPRKQSLDLTDAELRLMEVLWNRGSGTVSDVIEGLPESVNLAYSTVLTTLRVLENKGYLRHTKEGRAFVYRPAVGRDQARDSAIGHLVHRFFNGSPELLMLNLVEGRKVQAKQLRQLRERIAAEKED